MYDTRVCHNNQQNTLIRTEKLVTISKIYETDDEIMTNDTVREGIRPKPRPMPLFFQLLILAFTLLLYCGFIEWYLGWHVLLTAWQALSPGMVLVAIAMVQGSYLMRAFRIYDYFRKETADRYFVCIKISLYHNLINTLLPFRAGELSFPWLLSRYFGIGFIQSGTALLWFRFLDLHVIALFGIIVFVSEKWLTHSQGAMLMVLLVCLPMVVFRLQGKLLQQAQQYQAHHLGRLVTKALAAFPQTATTVWRTWLITLCNWLIKIAALAFILMLFADSSYRAACLGVIAGDLTSVLPLHSPGGFGSYALGDGASWWGS